MCVLFCPFFFCSDAVIGIGLWSDELLHLLFRNLRGQHGFNVVHFVPIWSRLCARLDQSGSMHCEQS